MGLWEWLAVAIFVAGYIAITLEHRLLIDKAASALITGVVLWLIAALHEDEQRLTHHLHEVEGEIFEILLFLLAAMALVEVLLHHGLFDAIRAKLARYNLTDRPQFIVLMTVTFFLSAALDNLTIAIVMSRICVRFFQGRNRLIAVAGVVIMANAGGAWSPIGDVTTIMLWLEGKFSATEIITRAFLPSLTIGIVATAMLCRKLDYDSPDTQEGFGGLAGRSKVINGAALASFALPLGANLVHLRPYMGLLLGLGVVWVLLHLGNGHEETHLEKEIGAIFKKIDLPALLFFVGILLSVGALGALGILESMSQLLMGDHPDKNRIAGGMIFLGLLSAVVDNVPLTALTMDLIAVQDPNLWAFMAVSVGTGGSALVIGSAAGVVAMSVDKELTFTAYLRLAAVPAVVSFVAGIVVAWLTLIV